MRIQLSSFLFLFLLLGCVEQFNKEYKTGEAALAGVEHKNGWIPDWLPEKASEVHLQYDIDTNVRWLRFRLDAISRAELLAGLKSIEDKEVEGLRVRRPRGANWWFEALIQQAPSDDAALYANIFRGNGIRISTGTILALDRNSDQIYISLPAK